MATKFKLFFQKFQIASSSLFSDIWHTAQHRQARTAQLQIFAKRGWHTSRDPYKIWYTLKHISETSKATDLKFGTRMHMNNFSKMEK